MSGICLLDPSGHLTSHDGEAQSSDTITPTGPPSKGAIGIPADRTPVRDTPTLSARRPLRTRMPPPLAREKAPICCSPSIARAIVWGFAPKLFASAASSTLSTRSSPHWATTAQATFICVAVRRGGLTSAGLGSTRAAYSDGSGRSSCRGSFIASSTNTSAASRTGWASPSSS